MISSAVAEDEEEEAGASEEEAGLAEESGLLDEVVGFEEEEEGAEVEELIEIGDDDVSPWLQEAATRLVQVRSKNSPKFFFFINE